MALQVNTPTQAETLLDTPERAAASIGFHVNTLTLIEQAVSRH